MFTAALSLVLLRPCKPDSLLHVLTSIVNCCIRFQVCPPALKRGVVVMIPKPGLPPDDVGNMRPITLLPELGKLVGRVLASRITTVLHQHPQLLCPAQRAYLIDGSSRQCISALMGICEDFLDPARFDKPDDLLSYPMIFARPLTLGKAFDSGHSQGL